MQTLLPGLLLIGLAAVTILREEAATVSDTPARWTAEAAWEWHRRLSWPVGVNYVPSTAVNTTEFWQAETFDEKTIDRELGWARGLGFNTCRVFLQYIVWKRDPDGLKRRMDCFLSLADRHGLATCFVLFDDCAFAGKEPHPGAQDPPLPGVHNSGWTPSPGPKVVTDRTAWPDLERYVRDVVGRFARDRRVLLWDLYNEPGNSGMGEKSLPLLEAVFGWARAARPRQPLTVSVWTDALPALSDRMLALSDVVSFHLYGDRRAMEQALAKYGAHGRPVLCTEWMARTLGSRWETDLPLFQEQGVGCYSWGLVNGRTQTHLPWASKAGDPEPTVWFHDLLRRDGTPCDPAEVAVIRRITDAPGVPQVRPLFDFPLRDTSVCLGPDGWHYLTGTTGHPTWWDTNEGIRIWRSRDLKSWEPLGLVWTFERDATWQKKATDGKQAVWAPEIFYLKGTFWLAYSVNYGGTGLLRSVSGKAEGPYVDVKPDGPLTGGIDASLFQDDDGAVYFVFQNGQIARMMDDMSGLAEALRLLKPANAPHVGFEGAFLFKANGRYYLSAADFAGGEYHCYVASACDLAGPWGDRFLAVPHGGHNMFFHDRAGRWWSTFFGNDPNAPFRERPAMLRVEFGLDGHVRPLSAKE